MKFTTKQLCFSALFTAIICIGTMVVQFPIPYGYAHLGDGMILFASYLFCCTRILQTAGETVDPKKRMLTGMLCASLASGLGSALADLLTGFAVWAGPTLLIKACMPVFAGLLFQKSKAVGAVVSLLWMVAGYTLFGALLYGGIKEGLTSTPGLLMKSAVNMIVFVILWRATSNTELGKKD